MTAPDTASQCTVPSLREVLSQYTHEAAKELAIAQGDGVIRCLACGHRCLIRPGKEGICHVRFNEGGKLRVPFGYAAGVACDPIEKKPFNHMLPGRDILTFGMLGCDFHCGYCQNWVSSQALRDPAAQSQFMKVTPEQLVQAALTHGAPAIASSYNEPLITSEWGAAVFRQAKPRGLKCAYVSNGNATPEVLDYLRPLVDAYKVDLKSFNDKHYRELGGVLENVLAGIRGLKQRGFWVEIVTLLVPTFNDDPEELKRMAEFLVGVDPLMPWHITAFHSDYKMGSTRSTRSDDLFKAGEIGRKAGMKYIYLGNLPGRTEQWEHTHCHSCGEVVIRRQGFHLLANLLTAEGQCPKCRTTIPGIWR